MRASEENALEDASLSGQGQGPPQPQPQPAQLRAKQMQVLDLERNILQVRLL